MFRTIVFPTHLCLLNIIMKIQLGEVDEWVCGSQIEFLAQHYKMIQLLKVNHDTEKVALSKPNFGCL